MSSASIRKDIGAFQDAAKLLSKGIQDASVDWNDGVYAGLSAQISEVAAASRHVITIGLRACESVDRFFSVYGEE